MLVSIDQGFVITDDFNPLAGMLLTKAEQYRGLLLERMGEEILFWQLGHSRVIFNYHCNNLFISQTVNTLKPSG